ncbi:MAG: caspase family protein [Bacteroidales bacterium]|nr:caspase family protein [Bacteroidales bacterium]
MKRLLFLPLLASLWFCGQAQTIEKARESFVEFVETNNNGGTKDQVYALLYQCYQDYAAVIENSSAGSDAYNEAKSGLREIYPYLQNGAAYHAQSGHQAKAIQFAMAFMDVPMMEAFQGEQFNHDANYATMAYFAVSNTYNQRDYSHAAVYGREYLATGDQKYRQQVFACTLKSWSEVKNYEQALAIADEALKAYPNDFNLLSMAINCAIDGGDNTHLQTYLTKALSQKPNDATLLNIQGKLYENTQNFQQALAIYQRLKQSNPTNLDVHRHLAINYYNQGVVAYNKALNETSEGSKKKLNKQANEYFSAAAATLEDVVANDPASLKYQQALATAYSILGENAQMEAVNNKIISLGGRTIDAGAVPVLMAYEGNGAASSPTVVGPSSTPAVAQSANSSSQPVVAISAEAAAPPYSQFAKEFVESRIRSWQQKDPYENVEEYQARVTEEARQAKVKEYLSAAEREYIAKYTKGVRFNDMLLKPYDAENCVFLVESRFGELVVPVPREKNEAQQFANSWSGMQFKDPQYYVSDDKLLLSSLTFVTPAGKQYKYDADKSLTYVETVVDMQFDAIDTSSALAQNTGGGKAKREQKVIKGGGSDVDIDIPETKKASEKTFAVIIANEDYEMVATVPMASNDGDAFRKYCNKTLGLPEKNIKYYSNASYGHMLRAMKDLKNIAAAYNGDLNVIFYYAGHGVPDESTKDAFLLPIDAEGTTTAGCYSLKKLYEELESLDANLVTVFLDACFSGAKREGGMLASARGIALKPKAEAPKGRMVVFSAASDEETAMAYDEKKHGLFTYYLLKKLQQTKGNVTLSELGDYLKTEVARTASVENSKPQHPTVAPSAAILDDWAKMKVVY